MYRFIIVSMMEQAGEKQNRLKMMDVCVAAFRQ